MSELKACHFICKRVEGRSLPRHVDFAEGEKDTYFSGYWDMTPEQAEELIGGNIYLHTAKAERSYFGGRVLSYALEQFEDEGVNRDSGIRFKFLALKDCKNVAWRGNKRAMAHSSGIIDLDVE